MMQRACSLCGALCNIDTMALRADGYAIPTYDELVACGNCCNDKVISSMRRYALDICNKYGAATFGEAAWLKYFGAPYELPYERTTAPPVPLDELQLVARGLAWKLSYNKLEQLIELGYVNSTGARLTEKGMNANGNQR